MGQVIDVRTPIVEEQLRRLQLMSDSAINYSLFKRPLNLSYFDHALIKDRWFGKLLFNHKSSKFIFLNSRVDIAVSYTHLTLPTILLV